MKTISALLTVLLFASACSDNRRAPDVAIETDVIPFRIDGHLSILRDSETLAELEIEIAETDSARTRGLMQRHQLPDSRGMFFIFDNEEDRAFWMANTPLSLDLMFIDADSTIISISKYMKPLSAQDVPSNGPARYVLEVIAGFSDTRGVIEGDRIAWTRTNAQ